MSYKILRVSATEIMKTEPLSIYLETSVISLIASRAARDPVNASRQYHSKHLFARTDIFQFVVSDVVKDEIT